MNPCPCPCPCEAAWRIKWEIAVEIAARAEIQRDQWRANHDTQVSLKRIISARPDLKERAPKVEKLMSERNRAQARSIRHLERIRTLESIIRTLDPTHPILAQNSAALSLP
jgi:hypothetical protein